MTSPHPILVTGASGFIGRHLVAALRADGKAVRALVRDEAHRQELEATGATTLVGDLSDGGVAERAARDVLGVFHLAGKLFIPGTEPREYERLHVDAMMHLLDASLTSSSLRYFVLCSTTGVHGPTNGRTVAEDEPGHPQNAYERTKAHAEEVARELASRRRAPLVIVRPGLVYGPGDRHLIGWFRSIRDGYYRVVGGGINYQHPIYIDDLVRAMIASAPLASPEGRAFHLVGPRPVTMRELSDAIGTAVGRSVPAMHLPTPFAYAAGALFEMMPIARTRLPLSRTRVTFLTQSRAYDGSRAREELGFVPRVELHDGLARTVAWYRREGWL